MHVGRTPPLDEDDELIMIEGHLPMVGDRAGTRQTVRAEQDLVDYASKFDPPTVARLRRHILHVVDPDLADKVLAKQLETSMVALVPVNAVRIRWRGCTRAISRAAANLSPT